MPLAQPHWLQQSCFTNNYVSNEGIISISTVCDMTLDWSYILFLRISISFSKPWSFNDNGKLSMQGLDTFLGEPDNLCTLRYFKSNMESYYGAKIALGLTPICVWPFLFSPLFSIPTPPQNIFHFLSPSQHSPELSPSPDSFLVFAIDIFFYFTLPFWNFNTLISIYILKFQNTLRLISVM